MKNSKTFKISPTSGIRVEAIEYGGEKLISIRKVFKTKKDPDNWQMGFQYVTVPAAGASKLGEFIKSLGDSPNLEFTHVEPKQKAKK